MVRIVRNYNDFLRTYLPGEFERREKQRKVDSLAKELALRDGFFIEIPARYKEMARIKTDAKEFVESLF